VPPRVQFGMTFLLIREAEEVVLLGGVGKGTYGVLCDLGVIHHRKCK
jgi:hypothetical protein